MESKPFILLGLVADGAFCVSQACTVSDTSSLLPAAVVAVAVLLPLACSLADYVLARLELPV